MTGAIRWERSDGWPRKMALVFGALAVGFALTGYLWAHANHKEIVPRGWLGLSTLSVGLALLLLCWRRTLRIAEGALWQGWGLKLGRTMLRVREHAIPLPPLQAVWVEERREHFKAWSQMFAVVGGVPRSLQRAVLDDELADRNAAERMARWLSEALHVPQLTTSC